ncbi:MAG TPA: helix-turn-helix transcriptional regulator [Ktedonobacterales bacterium]|nr:helix-turn-helix transcriptional regulator [Ktedonobacterales bacterium]
MSSYIILGLLEMLGPQTPYELKKEVDGSIAYFWDVPRAQLYVEPERLAGLGLVAEEREEGGRRRRVYRILDPGRVALRSWLRDTAQVPVELRDTGLLKLYFGFALSREELVRMAQVQAEMHRQRLQEYGRIAQSLRTIPDGIFALATLHMGMQYERLSIDYWDEIAANPPTLNEADRARFADPHDHK